MDIILIVSWKIFLRKFVKNLKFKRKILYTNFEHNNFNFFMSIENTITCIDIGSSKIRTIIGAFQWEDHDHLHVRGVWISESMAIRKGNILDMDEFRKNFEASLEDAERMAGEQTTGAFISFNSSSFEVAENKGIISVSGGEIEAADIERVLEMAKSGMTTSNREILKVVPESYEVDMEEWVKSPLGMSGRKLTVKAHIFSGSSSVLENIRKGIADVGIEVYDVFPNLMATPEWVLTKRQKELWVVCLDIGASTTGVTVYEEGSLKFSTIIPLGWDSVTSDIAICTRTSMDTAEKLKLEHAMLSLDTVEEFEDYEIDVAKITKGEEGTVSQLTLSKIVTARYEEILNFVRDDLRKIGKDGKLPEWVVLVGAGAKMKRLVEFTKETLKLPVIVWVPTVDDFVSDTSLSDPSFAGVLGALISANKYRNGRTTFSINIIPSIWGSIQKMFKKILP